MLIMSFVMFSVTAASAAEYALMFNDQEKVALLEALDAAVRYKGLEMAPNATFLANKIRTAPVVTERKDEPVAPKEK
jgi:hypothetical protein